MFKLMKYEIKKQMLSKIIILITLGILQCGFAYGILADSEKTIAIFVGLFVFVAIAATVFVSFESILTFSNDLKTKQSYMLFLTPNSTYSIVGAKVLSAIAQILLTGVAFAAIIIGNIIFLTVRYDSLGNLMKSVNQLINELLGSNIDLGYIIAVLIFLALNWLSVVIIAMLSITLSSTFLANNKFKGFVSVAIFFGLNFILTKIYELLIPTITFTINDFIITDIAILVVIVISYFATSFMLDKKVSV